MSAMSDPNLAGQGSAKPPQTDGEIVLPQCEAIGCDSAADWAFIGEGGDLYLCAFRGGKEPVEGWTWIGPMRSCGPCAGTGEYPPTDGDTCSFCGGEGEVPDTFGSSR